MREALREIDANAAFCGGDNAPTLGSVMVAMSGGVDSSVAALMLKNAGFDAAGVTMKLFGDDVIAGQAAKGMSEAQAAEGACCTAADAEDARQVALGLGLEHFTLNFSDVFEREVIERFCVAYEAGATPNPCIDCNRYVKFAALQRRRRQLGYDYLATGHYARRAFDGETGRYLLKTGLDAGKDQSYVLYHLTQEDLAHVLLPLGELTKLQVRALAAEAGFVNAEKPESQDICFVPDGDYAAFIERRRGLTFEGGPILDEAGTVLGHHAGLLRYTIGQRKGLGIAAPHPLYVLAKVPTENALVVGSREQLMVCEVWARDVNLIACKPWKGTLRVTAKTAYRQSARPAWAEVSVGETSAASATARQMEGETSPATANAALQASLLHVVFDEPIVRPAAGQSLVLYDGDVVIGGGTIC